MFAGYGHKMSVRSSDTTADTEDRAPGRQRGKLDDDQPAPPARCGSRENEGSEEKPTHQHGWALQNTPIHAW